MPAQLFNKQLVAQSYETQVTEIIIVSPGSPADSFYGLLSSAYCV